MKFLYLKVICGSSIFSFRALPIFFAAENFHEEVMHLPDPNIKESKGKDSQARWRNLKNECLANSVGLTQALSQAVNV